MRHFKVKTDHLKYILVDKDTLKTEIYHYKTDLAKRLGVSTRTLDRNLPYETEKHLILTVGDLFL